MLSIMVSWLLSLYIFEATARTLDSESCGFAYLWKNTIDRILMEFITFSVDYVMLSNCDLPLWMYMKVIEFF